MLAVGSRESFNLSLFWLLWQASYLGTAAASLADCIQCRVGNGPKNDATLPASSSRSTKVIFVPIAQDMGEDSSAPWRRRRAWLGSQRDKDKNAHGRAPSFLQVLETLCIHESRIAKSHRRQVPLSFPNRVRITSSF